MPNVYSIEINATPERVFYWLDDSQRILQWVPNIVENEDLEVTEDKVGSTFRQVYDENGKRMEMQGVVTAYTPNRQVACDICGDIFDLSVDYQLEDLGEKTRVTQTASVRFKGFIMKTIGPLLMLFAKKSSTKQLEDSFAKLKELAEAG